MKKTLLLSVVASTMIMAGGDIAPVEPVVEAPVAEASGWDLSGHAVVYYQTMGDDTVNLFDQEGAAADAGIQLKAVNNDVFAGIGMGFAVNGLSTLNLENSVVSNVMQGTGNLVAGNDIDDLTDGGWIAEAYLTYGMGNTSIKAGRQTLPRSLSPFAYSESWNVLENTFDSVLVVNTDIADTTIVGAWIYGANFNTFGVWNNITDFNALNDNDGVYMLTVQNKSIANLTLTGSYYTAGGDADTDILWGDAAYNAGDFGVAIQGGTVDDGSTDDMTAFGAKIDGAISGINLMAAYSSVDDGAMGQLAGETSALTNTVVDQINDGSFVNEDKIVVGANMDALGGNFAAVYADSSNDDSDYTEFDLVYSTKLTNALGLTAAYVYADVDGEDALDVVRVIANYNF